MSELGYKKLLRAIKRTQPEVIVVSGAPGSGKSTYVRENKTDQSIVVDLDSICDAIQGGTNAHKDHSTVLNTGLQIRELLYREIEEKNDEWDKAFIIAASPDRNKVEKLIRRFNAKEVKMKATREQCISQIRKDASRKGREDVYIRLANEWYDKMEGQL